MCFFFFFVVVVLCVGGGVNSLLVIKLNCLSPLRFQTNVYINGNYFTLSILAFAYNF